MVALVYSGTDYECSGDLFVVFAIFKELVAFFNSIVRGVFLQKTANHDIIKTTFAKITRSAVFKIIVVGQ